MKAILVIGASGHAKVVLDILEKQGRYEIAGLVDDGKSQGYNLAGYTVLGKVPDVPRLRREKAIAAGLVAIGDNWTRAKVVAAILEIDPGFEFITAIHPSAQLGRGVHLGPGSVVMAGAILNSDTHVGRHCIINTRASLDHDNRIGDFVSIAPGTTTGGNVQIGDYSVLSLGANVIHGIVIGEHTVIGAGATVLHDIPAQSVAFGLPARVQRTRQIGEKYL